MNIQLSADWLELLEDQFKEQYMVDLKQFLIKDMLDYKIFPESSNIFHAFNSCSLEKLKVVIIGQDPYHNDNQAHGLSFSVPKGVAIPPSLLNIYKELHSDLGIPISKNGDLSKWSEQGVLLLNSVLTVRRKSPASHKEKGWEIFTDTVISRLSDNYNSLVYILWGKFAQSKETLIDTTKHLVLKAAHPSPFSAYRGFFGCKHFSKTNTYLKTVDKLLIDW